MCINLFPGALIVRRLFGGSENERVNVFITDLVEHLIRFSQQELCHITVDVLYQMYPV